jgi:CRISPR/Cas system-associated protein Cas7 (RAMP superfamily)
MKKFKKEDTDAHYITYNGIKYSFLVDKEKCGIRRIDQKKPTENEVDKITHYIISEGWADDLIDNEEDSY